MYLSIFLGVIGLSEGRREEKGREIQCDALASAALEKREKALKLCGGRRKEEGPPTRWKIRELTSILLSLLDNLVLTLEVLRREGRERKKRE